MTFYWPVVTLFLLSLASLTGCASAPTYVKPNVQVLHAVRKLAIVVEGQPEFTHVGETRDESSAIIILFGATGAIIDTAVRNNADKKTAAAIKPEEVLTQTSQVLSDKLTARLKQAHRFDVVQNFKGTPGPGSAFDAVLVIKITRWGSRMKQTGSTAVIPCMDMTLTINNPRDQQILWQELQTVTFDTGRTMDEYQQQKALFRDDFAKLVDKAVQQIADLLLAY